MPRTSRGAGGKKATAGRGGRRRHASRPGRSRIRWSRRIGVSLALLLLGGSIVLAGRSVLPEGGSDSGAGDPPPAPTLVEPAETRTAADSIAVEVRLPADLPAADYRVRIYVNEVAARERAVPDRNPFRVSGVALEPGENLLSAALVGPTGESLHSRPITIVRDSAPLAITLAVPAPPPMTAAEWRIAGQTEPAAAVSIENRATGEKLELTADAGGRFGATIGLAIGANPLVIRARDELGNAGRLRLAVERISSEAKLALEVEPARIEIDELPTTLALVARVTDIDGRPANGASVTFSISPPGRPTATYSTTTVDGVARWRGFRLSDVAAARGTGWVTALVVLAGGDQLTESASFSVR